MNLPFLATQTCRRTTTRASHESGCPRWMSFEIAAGCVLPGSTIPVFQREFAFVRSGHICVILRRQNNKPAALSNPTTSSGRAMFVVEA
jgi:hypothetical protein